MSDYIAQPLVLSLEGVNTQTISGLAGDHPVSDPLDIIAQQLRQLFLTGGIDAHFDKLEKLIITEAYQHVKLNQVHAAALLGISRNVVRTLLKRHGFIGNQ